VGYITNTKINVNLLPVYSSIAGAMNAMAAVTLLDAIQPLMKKRNPHAKQDPQKTMIVFKGFGNTIFMVATKLCAELLNISVVFYGVLIVGMAFVTPHMGDSVIQLSLSIVGTLGGPVLAMFVLGILCPFVNAWVSMQLCRC
jgi:hypothetical protein